MIVLINTGVLYPEGYMGSNHLYLFNENDIDVLYYLGMQDQEEFEFRKELIQQVEKQMGSDEQGAK